jgi:hypothetical protein
MARSLSRANPIWNKIRLCLCCGKFIVLLRLPGYGDKTTPKWYIACYFKGWDGNPWYTRGSAFPHPRKRYAERMYPRATKVEEDPIFSLD